MDNIITYFSPHHKIPSPATKNFFWPSLKPQLLLLINSSLFISSYNILNRLDEQKKIHHELLHQNRVFHITNNRGLALSPPFPDPAPDQTPAVGEGEKNEAKNTADKLHSIIQHPNNQTEGKKNNLTADY